MELHVHQWGEASAPPLLCLHGVSSHGRRFRRLAEQRLADYHRVIAPDLRGHGLSEWDPPWDLETHVGDITETLDALELEVAALVGHSFGGRLAIELAAAHPDRVSRMVLLDPVVWVPPPVAHERAERLRVDESFATPAEAIEVRIAEGGSVLTPRRFLEEELPEHLSRGDDGRYRYRYSRTAVIAAYGEMAKTPPLHEVRAPALVVRGADSEVMPEALVDVCRDHMPDCSVVTVAGGHIVMWDSFEETAEAITAFLDR